MFYWTNLQLCILKCSRWFLKCSQDCLQPAWPALFTVDAFPLYFKQKFCFGPFLLTSCNTPPSPPSLSLFFYLNIFQDLYPNDMPTHVCSCHFLIFQSDEMGTQKQFVEYVLRWLLVKKTVLCWSACWQPQATVVDGRANLSLELQACRILCTHNRRPFSASHTCGAGG